MTADMPGRPCLLQARGVVKSFGQTPALRGADLQVAAGEMLAVMIPSGSSGKSTLVAGCRLAVAIGGGLADRKCPFTLLRVGGTPARTLYRVAFP